MLEVSEKKYTLDEFMELLRDNLYLIERQKQGLIFELPWEPGTKLMHVVETEGEWTSEDIVFVGMKVKAKDAIYIFEAPDGQEVTYYTDGVISWVKETEAAVRNTIKELKNDNQIEN